VIPSRRSISFKDKIRAVVKEHVSQQANTKQASLDESELIRTVRRKRGLWKRARSGREEMANYREVEKDATRKIWNFQSNWEKKMAKEKHSNSRPFSSYQKGKTRNRETVGPLKSSNNTVTEDDDIANMLNKYFASVFNQEDDGPVQGRRLHQTLSYKTLRLPLKKVLLQDWIKSAQAYYKI
jgi:hypothetical protein